MITTSIQSMISNAGRAARSKFRADWKSVPSLISSVFCLSASGILSAQEITGIVLVDPLRETDVQPLEDNTQVNLATYPSGTMNVRVDATNTESIGFVYLGGPEFLNRTENAVPYTLYGDNNGNYNQRIPRNGIYTLAVTPYSGNSRTGTAGDTVIVTFIVWSGIGPLPTPSADPNLTPVPTPQPTPTPQPSPIPTQPPEATPIPTPWPTPQAASSSPFTGANSIAPDGSVRVPLPINGPVGIEYADPLSGELLIDLLFDDTVGAFRRVDVEGGRLINATVAGSNDRIRVHLDQFNDNSQILVRAVDVVGNGINGDFEVRFGVLGGDLDRNGVRDSADIGLLRTVVGKSTLVGDVNNDGYSNSFDLQRVLQLVDNETIMELENRAPWISAPSQGYGIPGQMSEPIPLDVRDDNTLVADLVVNAVSSDQFVIADSMIETFMDGDEWFLRFDGEAGVSTLQVTVSDGDLEDVAFINISVETPLPPQPIMIADQFLGVAPLDVFFDATQSIDPQDNIESYDWNFGDGNSGSGAALNHTYTLPGDHEAVLTITDSTGLSTSTTRVISVASSAWSPTPTVSETEARRFLWQAAFGPGPDEVAFVMNNGFEAWINQQENVAPNYLDESYRDFANNNNLANQAQNFWESITIAGEDQLRQRVAWSLYLIIAMYLENSDFVTYNIYIRNALADSSEGSTGNYRELIEDITYNSVMGDWLTYDGNRKADVVAGTEPDQNYGREVMQLFTLGLWQMNPDGSFVRDVFNERVPTYEQPDVFQISRVFTGLRDSNDDFQLMEWRTGDHEFGASQLLNYPGAVPPSGFLPEAAESEAEAEVHIDLTLDNLVNHPTFAPFMAEQFIKRMVTSNPTPQYIERVTEAFVGNGPFGRGVNGDIFAAHKAMLLDDEARNPAYRSNPFYGKIMEPLILRHGAHRALQNLEQPHLAVPYQQEFGSERSTFSAMGQAFGSTPSVFSFFKPEFTPLNTAIANAGKVAPEAQILNHQTLINTTNIYGDLNSERMSSAILNELNGLANNPVALVDRLDVMLNYGSTHPDIKAIIADAVAANVRSNPDDQTTRRVETAIALMLNNPGIRHLR